MLAIAACVECGATFKDRRVTRPATCEFVATPDRGFITLQAVPEVAPAVVGGRDRAGHRSRSRRRHFTAACRSRATGRLRDLHIAAAPGRGPSALGGASPRRSPPPSSRGGYRCWSSYWPTPRLRRRRPWERARTQPRYWDIANQQNRTCPGEARDRCSHLQRRRKRPDDQ